MTAKRWVPTVLVAVAMTVSGCASGDDDGSARAADGATSTTSTTLPEVDRPDGPTAAIGPPLDGGPGVVLAAAAISDLDAVGYVESEHPAAGTATSYAAAGELPTDGTFDLTPGATADYATRIVARRPVDPADFSGTVIVEWLNVSSGADAAPDFTYLADEIFRQGHAWVGVSAQRIGIEGGPVAVAAPGAEIVGAGRGLRNFQPERYGGLFHPGDAFSYDIYTQVARALRDGGETNPFADLDVDLLVAVGESQSAFALTTYANGVQPLVRQFDGFLIHSRGGAAAPLGTAGAGIAIAETIGGPPTRIRTDLDVPTIVVQTESDVLGLLSYLPARQPDSELFRLWEIAGTAHADAFQVGAMEERMGCALPINRGQQSFVLRAALAHLERWARGGNAAPEAPRLDVDESTTPPAFRTDDVGNVSGGVRTPAVEAPLDLHTGLASPDSSIICLLFGSTTPLPAHVVADRYGDRDGYLEAYEQAADAAIDAGFVLDDDREALLAEAEPDRVG